MRRKSTLPELLAPAGDYESFLAAVAGGADAVYIGGQAFGARAYAKNFSIEEISQVVRYAHLHSVKVYVTVNTLVYDREMEELSKYIKKLWSAGVDALITADLGVISEIKRVTPDFPIHASTQMSVHNTYGVNAAALLGCERVVVARELPLNDIKSCVENSNAEIEVFLHGALCVSHSGQCLMSSLVGGRSGNRGECAQPCRLPYNKGKYILSLCDLSLANHIKELVESGVSSLKIEGRMKSPEYVYTVTSIYRRLLNENRDANQRETDALRKIFSRGGFTDGYFNGKKFGEMRGIRSEEDKKLTKESAKIKFEPVRKKVFARVVMKLGEPASMTLFNEDKSVTVTGSIPRAAINAPLDSEGVLNRLSKMGATFLSLSPEDIELSLEEGINLSPSEINALRRDASEKFEDSKRELPIIQDSLPAPIDANARKLSTAQFFSKESYEDYIKRESNGRNAFDIAFLPLEDFSGANGVSIPPVVFNSEIADVKKMLLTAKEKGAKYALVGNIGAIDLALECGFLAFGDFRLNICNSQAKETYRKLGVEEAILSPELTLPMARDIGGGEIVYGRIPVMLTERCFIKENFGCDKCGGATLEDRTGKSFPILKEYGHRNLILNSLPTYMGDKKDELKNAKISHAHFVFTIESGKQIKNISSSYMKGEKLPFEVRRIGKRSL